MAITARKQGQGLAQVLPSLQVVEEEKKAKKAELASDIKEKEKLMTAINDLDREGLWKEHVPIYKTYANKLREYTRENADKIMNPTSNEHTEYQNRLNNLRNIVDASKSTKTKWDEVNKNIDQNIKEGMVYDEDSLKRIENKLTNIPEDPSVIGEQLEKKGFNWMLNESEYFDVEAPQARDLPDVGKQVENWASNWSSYMDSEKWKNPEFIAAFKDKSIAEIKKEAKFTDEGLDALYQDVKSWLSGNTNNRVAADKAGYFERVTKDENGEPIGDDRINISEGDDELDKKAKRMMYKIKERIKTKAANEVDNTIRDIQKEEEEEEGFGYGISAGNYILEPITLDEPDVRKSKLLSQHFPGFKKASKATKGVYLKSKEGTRSDENFNIHFSNGDQVDVSAKLVRIMKNQDGEFLVDLEKTRTMEVTEKDVSGGNTQYVDELNGAIKYLRQNTSLTKNKVMSKAIKEVNRRIRKDNKTKDKTEKVDLIEADVSLENKEVEKVVKGYVPLSKIDGVQSALGGKSVEEVYNELHGDEEEEGTGGSRYKFNSDDYGNN